MAFSKSDAIEALSTITRTSLMPKDGRIVATISKGCGGRAQCASAVWDTVEVQRCRGAYRVPGGCFGPKGAIMKAINQTLPQHLSRACLSNGRCS